MCGFRRRRANCCGAAGDDARPRSEGIGGEDSEGDSGRGAGLGTGCGKRGVVRCGCTRLSIGRADAVGGDEGLEVGEVGRDAGGGDGFVAVNAGRDVKVEVEDYSAARLLETFLRAAAESFRRGNFSRYSSI